MHKFAIAIILVCLIGLVFIAGAIGTLLGSEYGALAFGIGLVFLSLTVGIGYFLHPPK